LAYSLAAKDDAGTSLVDEGLDSGQVVIHLTAKDTGGKLAIDQTFVQRSHP
jgi:hypothetical protein